MVLGTIQYLIHDAMTVCQSRVTSNLGWQPPSSAYIWRRTTQCKTVKPPTLAAFQQWIHDLDSNGRFEASPSFEGVFVLCCIPACGKVGQIFSGNNCLYKESATGWESFKQEKFCQASSMMHFFLHLVWGEILLSLCMKSFKWKYLSW